MTHNVALKDCLKGPYLKIDETATQSVAQELAGAEALYQQAQASWETEDFAGTLKQAYSAMYRAAQALVFAKGYRSDGFRCLETVLKTFWVGNDKLRPEDLATLRRVQALRGLPPENLAAAAEFVQRAKQLLA
ncbi:MAG: hypothetical protein GXP41_05350 [Chloroflexi bacterium]|nr:hypothetical protein [Chloroflexota bacterium]